MRVKYLMVIASIIVGTAVLLVIPFFQPNLAIYITIIALGLALALQKYIASFVGHFVIKGSNIFDVGDRIRIDKVKGDVKHLGLFHIILDEVGEDEKLGGELTGRIFHIPNLVVLDQPVLNYSRGYTINEELTRCGYMFDEIRIPLKTDSDIKKGVEILSVLLSHENNKFLKNSMEAFGENLPNFAHDLDKGPRITVHIDEGKIWIKGKFVTPLKQRNQLRTKINLQFIERIREDKTVEIA
ncbi:mechanosensitive ion channel protein MscS [Methanocella sp. CWC-04]|uniref:Mechanosensitive ion channel protein MscS n=2 Tax=Methanooceanicella nereidis TaxID=2052831 RepID=A0AAP2W8T6_9EURY|nr:mechanosensitive ion channel protein MscS [Methanocella sp. CWC-04]